MKIFPISILFGFFIIICCATNETEETIAKQENQSPMKINITFRDTTLTATLYDNPTAKDFTSMLPLSISLEDYANNEKIFYPDRKLTTTDAPNGYQPSKGDITYYAPWGDVAIFYKDFSFASGLISLGKIENNGIDELKKVSKTDTVVFELAD